MKKHRTTSPFRLVSLALATLLKKASWLAVLGGLITSAITRDILPMYVAAGALCLGIILTLIIMLASAKAPCPLCRCNPFVLQRFAVKKEATRFCGSVTVPIASKIITQGRLDCCYCEYDRSISAAPPEHIPAAANTVAAHRINRRVRRLPAKRSA